MTKRHEVQPTTENKITREETVISTADNKKIADNKGQSGLSSANHIIQLAKSFAVDGSLLPPEKQMPVEDRVERRARTEAQRKQLNIESIIVKTINYASAKTVTDKVDPDWFSQYMELAQGVSHNTMQELWAKILSKEIAHPGSFSIKTLKVFQQLSIQDAKLFAKAVALTMRDKSGKQFRILSGSYQVPSFFNSFDKHRQQAIDLSSIGLSYNDILVLSENNLLFAQETETSSFIKGQELAYVFQGRALILQSKKNNVVLKFYKLSPSGCELARLINDNLDDSILTKICQQLSHHFDTK